MNSFKAMDELIDRGDIDACADWIISLDDKSKQAIAKDAIKKYKLLCDLEWDNQIKGNKSYNHNTLRNRRNAAKVSIYGLASLSQIMSLGWRIRPDDNEFSEFIITRFSKDKEWVDDWINRLFELNQMRFKPAYNLYKKGFSNQPSHERFFLRMIHEFFERDVPLLQSFQSCPEATDEYIWKLFELEGEVEFNLAGYEAYTHTGLTWSNALVVLAENKPEIRERLLKSALDALDKDFLQKRAGWYSRFHEKLKPTLSERKSFEGRYLNLLSSQIPPTVSFALKALLVLDKKNKLDAKNFISHVEPALIAKAKGTVISALKIIEFICKNNSEFKSEAALLSTIALLNEHVEVHKKAIDIIEIFGERNDGNLKLALEANLEMVSPSQKTRLYSWVSSKNELIDTDESYLIPDYEPFGGIEPVASIDELIELLTKLLESAEGPIEVERALDGIARFNQNDKNELYNISQALLKRAKSMLSKFTKSHLYGEGKHWTPYILALTIESFIEGTNKLIESPYFKRGENSRIYFRDIFIEHAIFALGHSNQENSTSLLAFPTHGRGFINANVLLERYRNNINHSIQMPIIEQVLGILRIDPRIQLQGEQLSEIDDEFIQAVKFSLGEKVVVGKNVDLWIAASRIRNDKQADKVLTQKFGYQGADGLEAAIYSTKTIKDEGENYTWYWLEVGTKQLIPKTLNINHISTLFHQYARHYYSLDSSILGEENFLVRWSSTVWPGNLEPYFAHAAHAFYPDENTSWYYKCFFEPLLMSDVKLDKMAILFLCQGLAALEISQKGIALEVAIQTISEDRLDINLLSTQMAYLLPSGYIKVARWTKMFNEISSISKKHCNYICDLLPKILRHDPANSPRDLGGMLELLYEIQISSKSVTEDEEAIAFYKSNKKGGKQGKSCKALLSLCT